MHYVIPEEGEVRAQGFKDLYKESQNNDGETIHYAGIKQEDKLDSSIKYPNLKAIQMPQSGVVNLFGLPVFMPVQFVGQNYLALDKEGNVRRVKLPTIYLPFSTLIEVSREKEIAKTQPNGVTGTNKEFWSFGDWKVNLKGVVFDEPKVYPQEILDTLAAYESICESIEVVCPFLNRLGINRITIDSYSQSQIKGMPNVIPFSMDCSSDNPQELIIEDAL
jgi:hypothetical protein